ncbi:MAG: hypothetical protein KF781_11070 [Chitinophagaceae bacterium]|nr:hypothetical protein [Chitinophagaceae bacterium]MCW5906203.1 hypothetical protein [Chitinophagaceae bacterium]
MKAIHTKAKRNKRGNFVIQLPSVSEQEEIDVTVVFEKKKKQTFNLLQFAGKLQSKTNWHTYQKKVRAEWE